MHSEEIGGGINVNNVSPHTCLGYKPPVPEVFVPAFAAWPASLHAPTGHTPYPALTKPPPGALNVGSPGGRMR